MREAARRGLRLAPPLLVLALTSAWGNAGDEALTAYRMRQYPRAFLLAQAAAKEGDYLGFFVMGRLYEKGQGVPAQNRVAGDDWLRKALAKATPAALSDKPRGQYVLARENCHGRVLPQNVASCASWLTKAAHLGYVPALAELGVFNDPDAGYVKNGAKSFQFFLEAAGRGDAVSQAAVATHYLYGSAVTKDVKAALAWYRKSADQGFVDGQAGLSLMYDDGIGVPADPRTAAHWERLAAEQGAAADQNQLALMYANGHGVALDYEEAAAWYRRAADQGNADAQYGLGTALANGLGVEKDENEAALWYRRAAEQGSADAQYALGAMEYHGQGTYKDRGEAMTWVRKAADQGHAQAQYVMGLMYSQGFQTAKNDDQAMLWFQKSAKQGNAQAAQAVQQLAGIRRGTAADPRPR